MKSSLAVDALSSAVARRRIEGPDVAGCVVHTDRGSQFRSWKFLAALRRHDLVGSMGQVASAGDNAAMESFFALLPGPLRSHSPPEKPCHLSVQQSHACLEATEGAATPVHANDEWLLEQGVRQWTEIPLWRTNFGTWQVNGAKAAAAGFTCRPLPETVLDTWAGYQKQQPVYHPRQDEHGMDPAREEHLVRLWSDLAGGDATREES